MGLNQWDVSYGQFLAAGYSSSSGRIAGRAAEFFEVQAVKNFAVQVGFDLLVLTAFEGLQIRHGNSRKIGRAHV